VGHLVGHARLLHGRHAVTATNDCDGALGCELGQQVSNGLLSVDVVVWRKV
jgi:hypothetical protein